MWTCRQSAPTASRSSSWTACVDALQTGLPPVRYGLRFWQVLIRNWLPACMLLLKRTSVHVHAHQHRHGCRQWLPACMLLLKRKPMHVHAHQRRCGCRLWLPACMLLLNRKLMHVHAHHQPRCGCRCWPGCRARQRTLLRRRGCESRARATTASCCRGRLHASRSRLQLGPYSQRSARPCQVSWGPSVRCSQRQRLPPSWQCSELQVRAACLAKPSACMCICVIGLRLQLPVLMASAEHAAVNVALWGCVYCTISHGPCHCMLRPARTQCQLASFEQFCSVTTCAHREVAAAEVRHTTQQCRAG